MKNFAIVIIFFSFIGVGLSQQLVYQPINSAFGGNSYNQQWLQSSASAQNPFKDKGTGFEDFNSLDNYADSIKRQILSRLSNQLFNQTFGNNDQISAGTYNVGGLVIDITEVSSGVLLTIIDTTTGESTEILF